MICLCHVLSERIKLKDYIGRICFYPPTHMICPTGSVTPVAVRKKIKITQKNCQNEHLLELLKHFGAKELRYRSKCTMFF